MRTTIKALRKIIVLIAGSVVLIIGVIMMVTPGPGLAAIVLGLLILSIEFDWAKRYLHTARQRLSDVGKKVRNSTKKKSDGSAKNIDRAGNNKSQRKS